MRRRKKKQKLKSMKQHARTRFFQRYGVSLSEHLRQWIIGQIQKNQAIPLEKQSNRVTIFLLEVEGQKIPVAYDKNRKEIITALPKEALEQYSLEREEALNEHDRSDSCEGGDSST